MQVQRQRQHSIDDGAADAADTLRFARQGFDSEAPTDPGTTAIYNLGSPGTKGHSRRSAARRRQIRDTRENVLRLREALAEGWEIGPELAHEERRLAALEAADRRAGEAP